MSRKIGNARLKWATAPPSEHPAPWLSYQALALKQLDQGSQDNEYMQWFVKCTYADIAVSAYHKVD